MDTDWTFISQSWLWEEDATFKKSCIGSDWTREEDKAFENALAIHHDDADRWEKIALAVPGKTIDDIKLYYEALVDDVAAIEYGKVPLPHYSGEVGVRKRRKKSPGASMKRGVPWTVDEHKEFLYGLWRFGRGDWKRISRYSVHTRSNSQVASHAQKYFKRLRDKVGKRPSINDITSVPPELLLALEKATTSCMPKEYPDEKSTRTKNQKLPPKNPKKASTNYGNQLLPVPPKEALTNSPYQLLTVYPKEASSSAGNEPFKGYPEDASTNAGNELRLIYAGKASTNVGKQLLPVCPKEVWTTEKQVLPGYSVKASNNAASELLPGSPKEASSKAGSQLLKGYPKEASTNAGNKQLPGNPKEASTSAHDNQVLKGYTEEALTVAGNQQLPGNPKEASTNVANEASTNTVYQLFPGDPNEDLANIRNQMLPPIPFAGMSIDPFFGHTAGGSTFTAPFASQLTQEPGFSTGMPAYGPSFASILDSGVPPAGWFGIASTSYADVLDLDEFVLPHFLD